MYSSMVNDFSTYNSNLKYSNKQVKESVTV